VRHARVRSPRPHRAQAVLDSSAVQVPAPEGQLSETIARALEERITDETDPFESAWLKWAMAVTNARVLEDNIETFASSGNLEMYAQLSTYYDARRHCVLLVVVDAKDPFPTLWGSCLATRFTTFDAA
jgi:hypothetical protein